MSMSSGKTKLRLVGISGSQSENPTIYEVHDAFLAELEERLSAKTFRKYKSAVELLQHCLNEYGYQYLNKIDSKRFEKLFDEGKQFCEIFGPAYILPVVDEFLNYFMVRKVMASKEVMGASGTMTKKMAKWLGEKGYVTIDEAREVAEHGAEAARNLPKAEQLAMQFRDLTKWHAIDDDDDDLEDHFPIVKVEKGKIWLEAMLDGGLETLLPVSVPAEISKQCQVGWSISGVVGKRRDKWKFIEVWNVYPN